MKILNDVTPDESSTASARDHQSTLENQQIVLTTTSKYLGGFVLVSIGSSKDFDFNFIVCHKHFGIGTYNEVDDWIFPKFPDKMKY